MIIDRIEVDISHAKTNQAGDIFGIIVTGFGPGETRGMTFKSDASGVHVSRHCDGGVAITNHYDIQVDHKFVEKVCEIAGFETKGQMLVEANSNTKVRIFVPTRARRTYMG